jgi:hypothetical protein
MMPPSWDCGLALVRLTMLTPRTTARSSFGMTGQHFAGRPLSLPVSTTTLSPLRIFRSHYSTSGASEMIFMWFLARSSRGTGPKIRVPIGSFCC